jgi:4-hydroxybutyrate CoA-transferase
MARRDLTIDWQAHFDSHITTMDEAVAVIRSGDHVWCPPLHAPMSFYRALADRIGQVKDVQVRSLGLPDPRLLTPEAAQSFHFQDQFANLGTRAGHTARTIDYHPHWLVGAHKALDAGREGEAWQIDHCVITVSPPNERGFCSVGGNCWDSVTSARRAKRVIANVNPVTVETFGDTWLHVSEMDAFVLDDTIPVVPPVPPEEVDAGLAHYVDTLVNDGATVQVGTGSHTSGMVKSGLFKDRQELSYFGELTVEGLVPLAERGVFTGRTSQLHPGKFVATLVGNNLTERQVIHRNPAFELYSIDYILNPATIARNDRIVAINGALSVDLTGQGCAYTIGQRIYAGMGGHLAFAMGAFLSPRGRYVCILPSTANGGTVSTIAAQFQAGQVVSVPREIADTVVTEWGIARLLNKSVRQRAEELISIAHPDFRAELRRAARRMYWP